MANENVLSLDENQANQNPADNAASTPAATPSGDDIVSALKQLVGTDKKFKSEEDLAKGKIEADAFIDHLKEENKGLRAELEAAQRKAAEDQVAAMRDQLSKAPAEQTTEEVTPSQLSSEDIESHIEKFVTRRENQRTAQANLDSTNSELVKHFGDPEKAGVAVRARAEALGLSLEDVTKMAARSPKAALELIRGGGEVPALDISKTSSVDGATASEGLANLTLKEQFTKMRRENPTKFFSSDVQNQIFQLKKEGKL